MGIKRSLPKRMSPPGPKNQHIVASPAKKRIELLEQALQSSPDLIAISDHQGRFIFANKAFLNAYGYSEETIPGAHFAEILSLHNPRPLNETIGKQCFTKGGWSGECLSGRMGQPDLPVWLIVGPVMDENGDLAGAFGIARDVSEKKNLEQSLQESNKKLTFALETLKEYTRKTVRITELLDILQTCENADEAYKILETALPALLPSPSGALCITSASRNIVEAVACWGDPVTTAKAFRPDECWALRRGKLHCVTEGEFPLRCGHVGVSSAYVCVPLVAQGETLGLLYTHYAQESRPSSEVNGDAILTFEEQIAVIAKRISLTIANLRLREVLRGQSLRDPLTGLFNRRYMEAGLERELRRAAREKQTVSVLMTDIDHFKRFNDTFGHQAGDALLRDFGSLLLKNVRGEDIICRYGGEEFVCVLPGTTLATAVERAESLRNQIKALSVQHQGQVLGTVTASFGVAQSQDNNTSVESLLKAADDALYRAKHNGRDRVETQPPSPSEVVFQSVTAED